MVDAQTAMQGEDLFRDLIRRADQETVADQALEPLIEAAVILRHVLAPSVIGFVLGAQVRGAETDGFRPVFRDEDLAPHGQLRGERLTGGVERAAVECHLAFDGGDLDSGADIPAIAQTRGALDGGIGIGAHPDGRMRTLQRFGQARGIVEFEIRGFHLDLILGPQPLDRRQAGLEPGHPLRARHAERLELDIAVAEADAEDDLTAGDDVEGGEFFRHMQRRHQGQQQHARVEPHARRLGGEARQHGHHLQHLERVRAVMRGLGDGSEPELVRQPHESQGFLEPAGNVLAFLGLSADDEAELEVLCHAWFPLPMRGVTSIVDGGM